MGAHADQSFEPAGFYHSSRRHDGHVACTVVGQISTRRPLVAFLSGTSASPAARYVNGFMLGLQEFGYVEGREINVAFRYAEGDLTRLSALADELFQLQPTVFLTGSTAATLAVRRVRSRRWVGRN